MKESCDRIKEAMKNKGIPSAAELARRSGQKASTVRSAVNSTRGLSKDMADALARPLGVDPGWLIYGKEKPLGKALEMTAPQIEHDPALPPPHNPDDNEFPEKNFQHAPEVDPNDRSWLEKSRLPLWGTVMAGEDGAFEMNTGEALEYVPRPPRVESPKAYCIRIEGDSMEDYLHHGDLLFVDPAKKPLVGRFAVIEIQPDGEAQPLRGFVKRIVALSTEYIRVKQYNPPREWEIPRHKIKSLHLVLNNNEMY